MDSQNYFMVKIPLTNLLSKADGINSIYISTNHNGLYEKYGYEFFGMMKDVHGEDSRVYVRYL